MRESDRTQPKYAAGTDVAVSKTILDIQRELERFGASGFGMVQQYDLSAVVFVLDGRRITFSMPRPNLETWWIARTPSGGRRSKADAERRQAQADRQQWRILLGGIKALLVMVDAGVWTVDEAFLAFETLPSGETVGEWAAPQLERVFAGEGALDVLPGVGPSRPELTTAEGES